MCRGLKGSVGECQKTRDSTYRGRDATKKGQDRCKQRVLPKHGGEKASFGEAQFTENDCLQTKPIANPDGFKMKTLEKPDCLGKLRRSASDCTGYAGRH
jgi:hypothetical protein